MCKMTAGDKESSFEPSGGGHSSTNTLKAKSSKRAVSWVRQIILLNQLIWGGSFSRDANPEDNDSERGYWKNRLEYITALVAAVVGLGNVFRFPYVVQDYGRGAFLLVYLISNFFVGAPLLYLQVFIGQFCSRGPAECFSAVPLFRGVGLCTVLWAFFLGVTYASVAAYIGFYIYASFAIPLPWASCGPDWYTDNTICVEVAPEMCNPQKAYVRHLNGSCLSNNTVVGVWNLSLFQQHTGKVPVLAETYYLESEVAGQIGVTRDTMSDMQLHLLLSLFIVWFIICLGLIGDLRGIIHCIPVVFLFFVLLFLLIRSFTLIDTGMVVNHYLRPQLHQFAYPMCIPVVFPFFVLLFLLIKSFTLVDTDMVVNHYLRPQLHQFAYPMMWCHVIQQNIFSLSLDSGTIIALSSYNRFHDKLFRPVIITVCVDACTSCVAAFIVFAQLDEIDFIQSSVKSGYPIAFEMYTRSVTDHKAASFLSIVLFLAMFLMALTAIVENCRSILIAMTDQWPSLVRRQIPAAVLFCIVCFLLGLPFVTRGGMLLGKLADDYMLTFSPNLTTLLTLIAFTLIYGTDRLYRDLKLVTGNPPSLFWKYVWWALIPVLLSTAVLSWTMQLKLTEVEPLTKELYSGYGWKILLNLMKLGPPSSIVIVMLISLLKRPRHETCLEKIQALMSPEDSWGPALVKHRIMVNYVSGFVVYPTSMNSDGSYDNPKKDQKRTKPHTFGTRIGSSAEDKNTSLASSSFSSDKASSVSSCSSDFGKSRSERTTRSSSREGEQADNERLSTSNACPAIALSKQGSIIKDPSEKRRSTVAPKKVVSLNLGGKSNVVLPGTTSVNKVHSRGTIGSTDSDYMFGDSGPPPRDTTLRLARQETNVP